MEKYGNEGHYDFSGGVQQAVGRLLQADNEVVKIENGTLDKIGTIFKVRGYVQRGSTIRAGYNVLGLASAYKSDGTQKQIAVVDGPSTSDAYTFNPINNTWTPHVLGLTTGAKAEFEYFLDGFFMVNFSDVTRFNNFTAWSSATNVTNAPKAKYAKLYLSRLYLAYVVDNGTTYTSRVIYSELPSSGTIAWNNSVNYFDVDTDNSDVLKGMGVNSSRLLLFKEKTMYRYDTNTLYQVPGCPGTVSHRTIKNCLGYTFYLHTSGIWGYNGETSKLMSRKIQDIIEGMSTRNLANSSAYVKDDHYYCYVGDIFNQKTGLTIDKCLIDYDVAKNAYTWRSLEKEPTVFEEYRDDRSAITYDDATVTYNDANVTYNGLISAEQKIYFGNTDGAVYQDQVGRMYDGTDISFSVETKDYYLGNPSLWKLLQKVIVYVSSGGKGVTVQFKLDDNDWKTLGRVDKVQKELIFPYASHCQRVRFRILEKSSGDRFSFEGLDIYYTLQGLIE